MKDNSKFPVTRWRRQIIVNNLVANLKPTPCFASRTRGPHVPHSYKYWFCRSPRNRKKHINVRINARLSRRSEMVIQNPPIPQGVESVRLRVPNRSHLFTMHKRPSVRNSRVTDFSNSPACPASSVSTSPPGMHDSIDTMFLVTQGGLQTDKNHLSS